MSEYQFYEFVAVDYPLTPKQIGEVREWSSRAEISSTRFVNEYHWGSFKGDPEQFLRKWFDAMVYFANWGTHQFMMRAPADAIDLALADECCAGESARLIRAGENVIFNFTSDDEDGYEDWGETEGDGGWMGQLLPLREELLRGDTRPVYLAWLLCAQTEELPDKEKEPPVPAGLRRLSGAQTSFAEFLRIDRDLLSAAARASSLAARPIEGLEPRVASLPAEEKDRLLAQFIEGGDPQLGAKLRRRFQAPPDPATDAPRRTVRQLLDDAEQIRREREELKARRGAEDEAKRAAEAAAARAKHLADLAARQEQAWQEIERLVSSKGAKAYEEALTMLCDLADVGRQESAEQAFRRRVSALCERHTRKTAFVERLRGAKLL